MIVLSRNVSVMGNRVQRAIIKEVICKSKVDLVLLQETKLHPMIDSIVNDLGETLAASGYVWML